MDDKTLVLFSRNVKVVSKARQDASRNNSTFIVFDNLIDFMLCEFNKNFLYVCDCTDCEDLKENYIDFVKRQYGVNYNFLCVTHFPSPHAVTLSHFLEPSTSAYKSVEEKGFTSSTKLFQFLSLESIGINERYIGTRYLKKLLSLLYPLLYPTKAEVLFALQELSKVIKKPSYRIAEQILLALKNADSNFVSQMETVENNEVENIEYISTSLNFILSLLYPNIQKQYACP